MPLGSSSDAPVMRPGPSRVSSRAQPLLFVGGLPDAVPFHVAVAGELVVVPRDAAGFDLVGFTFGVHAIGIEVVRDGAPLVGGRFFMLRLVPVCHCASPVLGTVVHGQYHSRYLTCTCAGPE